VDKDSFALIEYGHKREVKVTTRPRERADKWAIDRAKSSEESNLPHGDRPGKAGVTVTNSVQVE
jgi:hypothetical protein